MIKNNKDMPITLSKVVKAIEDYPDELIPLAWACPMIRIRHQTFAQFIRQGRFNAVMQEHNCLQGHRYYVTKETAKKAAIGNQPIIERWITKKNLAKELGTTIGVLGKIEHKNNLLSAKGFSTSIRYPKETVKEIKTILSRRNSNDPNVRMGLPSKLPLTIQGVINIIEEYPKDLLPMSFISLLTGVDRGTLNGRVDRKQIRTTFDGYRHYVTKYTASKIARQNKHAIWGWMKRSDLAREIKALPDTLSYMAEFYGLEYVTDDFNYVRFSPKAVQEIRRLYPEHTAKDTYVVNNQHYVSLIKMADDMAANLARRGSKKFTVEKERIYKCLHTWVLKDQIPFIRTGGSTRVYVPEEVYRRFVSMVRITDSSILCGRSKRTIYNWINKGVLKVSKTDHGYSMISVDELDAAMALKLQLELIRKFKEDREKLPHIDDFNSLFWNGILREARAKKSIAETIEVDPAVKRGLKGVSKRRSQDYLTFSLDKKVFDDEGSSVTFLDNVTYDEPEVNIPFLYEAIDALTESDRDLVGKLFGVGDASNDMTIEEMADEQGVSVERMQKDVDRVLSSLKDNMEVES